MTEQRKKLSEIGETVMIHLNKGNEPHEWLTEIHMSIQERRELVEKAYMMGLAAEFRRGISGNSVHTPFIDELFMMEGL
jgi:hypothetical protein